MHLTGNHWWTINTMKHWKTEVTPKCVMKQNTTKISDDVSGKYFNTFKAQAYSTYLRSVSADMWVDNESVERLTWELTCFFQACLVKSRVCPMKASRAGLPDKTWTWRTWQSTQVNTPRLLHYQNNTFASVDTLITERI